MTATELLPEGVKSLEQLSKNWDGKTAERLVHVRGGGDMFGGSGELTHIMIHGENSIKETGTVEIRGKVTYTYNIARGGNGPTESTASYYPVNRNTGVVSERMEKQAHVHGSCAADDALATILNLKKDWVIK